MSGRFELREHEHATLVLTGVDGAPLPIPEHESVQRRLSETLEVWRSWVARQRYDGPWREAVERSLLAIRLLADARSGAIAAAGTTSLPEVLDGDRNYDYRFGWVRDLCFALDALLDVGMQELVQASITWLLSATSHTPPQIDPIYALSGDVVREQHQIPLPGYRHTTPVRVGNNAGRQLQLGGFGDFMETMTSFVEHGHVLSPDIGERLADVADLLTLIWRNEDSGLRELSDRSHASRTRASCSACR